MKIRSKMKRTATLVAALCCMCMVMISALASAKKAGPSGTFRNDDGFVKLAYQGEGMVAVELKTKYCKLVAKGDQVQANTFVFPDGIEVVDKKGKPVLVIFYQKRKIVVYAQLKRFKQRYCKGGLDATGLYKRSKK